MFTGEVLVGMKRDENHSNSISNAIGYLSTWAAGKEMKCRNRLALRGLRKIVKIQICESNSLMDFLFIGFAQQWKGTQNLILCNRQSNKQKLPIAWNWDDFFSTFFSFCRVFVNWSWSRRGAKWKKRWQLTIEWWRGSDEKCRNFTKWNQLKKYRFQSFTIFVLIILPSARGFATRKLIFNNPSEMQ